MKKSFLKNLMGILLALFCQYAYAQNRTITGTVISKDDGLPIPGVSVVVKGYKTGTQTSATGKFTLSTSAKATTLVFTFIGYETQEVTIPENGIVAVTLKNDFKLLSEVVVTGSGVATSKTKLGIAVEAVSGKGLAQTPQASIDQGLVGKVPGAQISAVDGTPGARTNILLRGINTIQGGTSPMILVDGVESRVTDISLLDPATVDHLEVVQGAAASTIYGAQGANGVIQVFTKKGQSGKARVDISSSVTASDYINSGDVHQAKLSSFLTDATGNFITTSGSKIVLNEDGIYPGVRWQYQSDANNPTAMSNPLNIARQQYGTNLKYYDHLKQLFRTAYTTNYNASISGGTDKSDYNLTISNNHQQSNIRTNGYNDRTNLTTNLGTELFKGFTIRNITQLIYNKNTLNPAMGNGNSGALYAVLNASPFYDLNQKLASGDYPLSLNSGSVSVNGSNPFYFSEYGSKIDNRVDVLENLQANYKINKFVELNAKYGINYSHEEANYLYKSQTENQNSIDTKATYGAYGGELDKNTYTTVFQNFNGSATIRTDFEKDFHINVPITTSTLLQYDYRKNNYKQFFTQGIGLPSYAIYNFGQTSTQAVTSDYTEPFVTFGYVVNQKIDVGEYGGVSGGFRSDYSSAFGEGSKPFTFPNVNGYLRVSSFDFWKNSKLGALFPEWKLRAAYGEAGIQPGPFDRYPTVSTGNLGSALVFTIPANGRNPALNVEVSKEYEYGTDLAIKGMDGNWLSDFSLSATYWRRKGSNVIYNVSVAPSTGSSQILTNAIDLSSHGVQASLNISVLKTRDFNWGFTTNFSNETSKIDNINGPPIILTTAAGSTQEALVAGQKIGQIYGFKALTSLTAVNHEGARYISDADLGSYEVVKGRVVNKTTKAIQFENEVSPLGDPNPKFNMSFINSFSYKKLSFGFQFDWVHGSHLYNQTKEWMYRDGINGDYDNAVTIGGQSGAYTAYYRSAYADFFGARNGARNGTKDYFYEDASFLRLRNVSLAYDFSGLIKGKIFRKAILTFTGRNLFTSTKYTGFDPEISSGGSNSAFDRGVDHSSMPNSKSYQVGLSLGF
jgi:TonB-linked SusC/RagA family outer membrane protein